MAGAGTPATPTHRKKRDEWGTPHSYWLTVSWAVFVMFVPV
jgi:hypothetical protein